MIKVNIQLVKEVIPEFHEFLEAQGQQLKEERQKKDSFFQAYFSAQELPKLEAGTLREMIHILWAWNSWTNKDYLLEQMLLSGLPTIREAFQVLLYSGKPIAERYNYMRSTVRMMGAVSISEILAHHDPEKYPIWNRRSKNGLIALGIEESRIPRYRYNQISGAQYEDFCQLVQDVRKQIATQYPEFSDLFTLYFFLYFISQRKLRRQTSLEGKPVSTAEDFEHDAIIDQVLELGDGLGFEVQKEFNVVRGGRIDAIWRSRIANLGTIAYAFEVHRRGSRDSAILNLQRIKRDPTIQKVILVSTGDELEKFKEEIASLDESFRNSVGYFEVQDLQSALDHLEALKGTLRTLGLLNVEGLFERS